MLINPREPTIEGSLGIGEADGPIIAKGSIERKKGILTLKS
jgi:hypothetical protein